MFEWAELMNNKFFITDVTRCGHRRKMRVSTLLLRSAAIWTHFRKNIPYLMTEYADSLVD